ncbi:hypothetical protein KV557_24405 [Kitasatospora aureofaciens]|uniref:hypothetical protein n=1 Tax=Kitasatospora aureofaciens TaxID=1894 RepID=UPI001C47334A|nr:hypothetical protein [Kitasatospora aureofaciens]MBV6700208.1 hypothetical protein [Kitasatospora aureofaciens]
MSKVRDLQKAQQAMTSIDSIYVGFALFDAIGKALAVGGPVGSPGTIRERAKAYADTAKAYGKASADLGTVAANQLPSVWTGSVAEHAAQAVQALANELTVSQKALQQAAGLLGAWADDLEWAQNTDAQGVVSLQNAQKSIAGDLFDTGRAVAAFEPAQTGVAARLAAAQRAESSGTHTASMVDQLAAQARAERAGQGPLDPLAALVLANEKGPGADADGGYILTDNQLARATQFLDVMNGADQGAFRNLLSGAKSPEEAAYLWKALAAGHSVAEVEQFGALIHPHGDDPTWLSQHLVPALSTDSARQESTTENVSLVYQGKEIPSTARNIGVSSAGYGQGNVGDCVAASTVVAHLKLDPVTMLRLTTGNMPDTPGADSPTNFSQRLQDLYIQQYQQGQQANGDKKTYPQVDQGVGPKGNTFLADQDLGKATGDTYEYVTLNTEDDRRAAVARIEKALDEGKPVPFCAHGEGGKDNHQMVIMARDGDRLQVYNPWGRSEWVTEDQFIHSHVNDGHLTDNVDVNMPYGAELPK